LGNTPEQDDRAIAGAAFELREIAFRHVGMFGQRLARHAAPAADLPHPLTQAQQKSL